ncbi:MAG: protein phosphatase 2C domain-containing protein [Candidatus Cloacimonadales bacterium]|nr:protein phosphatase 2C domain-containing protein [Candidatus Cloacimonadales bacterium]
MSFFYNSCSISGRKSVRNEDFILVPEIMKQSTEDDNNINSRDPLFILCDGIGGHNSGHIASKMCAEMIAENFYNSAAEITDYKNWFSDIFSKVNQRILELGKIAEDYQNMGTTVVSLVIKDNVAFAANIGDSRLYLAYQDRIIQITEDHSQVWKLYKAGRIRKNDLIRIPGKNIITKAIGIDADVEPDFYKFELPEKYIILMCSDGLTDVVIDTDIKTEISRAENLEEIIDNLYSLALHNRSNDDISMIIVSNYLE